MSVAPPPPGLTDIADRVERCLADYLRPQVEGWSAFDDLLRAPMEEITRLVACGGKRIRPAFAYWGQVAAVGNVDDLDPAVVESTVRVGAALELMHAFALFHDDVMDDATTRRGADTTHVTFTAEHQRSGWVGEGRRFGEGIAILVGDLAFVYSDDLLSSANSVVWRVWNDLRIELNVGQLLDLLGSAQRVRSVQLAERICRYKSGKYSVERPLHLGAANVAPDRFDELAPALSAYGLPIGDAFQMRDDVLGAFGATDVTGKPVGVDLREGKPTPLLARAVRDATPAQRAVLDLVGAPDMTDDDVARAQQVIVDTGALADLEATIIRLTDEGVAALSNPVIAPQAVAPLTEMAMYVTQRDV